MQRGKDFCHYFRSTWKLKIRGGIRKWTYDSTCKGPHTTQAAGWCWSICIPEPWTHLGSMENVPQVSALPPPGCHNPDISISEISYHQGIGANVRATWGFWSTLCVGLRVKSVPKERSGDQCCPWQAPDRGKWKIWDNFFLRWWSIWTQSGHSPSLENHVVQPLRPNWQKSNLKY